MSLTIKELADQLSVSKTAIRKHMDDEFRSTYTIKQGNKILIKDEGASVLKEQFKNAENSTENSEVKKETASANPEEAKDATALLAEQLENQRKQIEEKDKQISELHQLLDQSQRLQLDVQNKLKQLQNEMGNSADTKAIQETVAEPASDNTTNTTSTTTAEPSSTASKSYQGDPVISDDGSHFQATPPKKKHWWQFGR